MFKRETIELIKVTRPSRPGYFAKLTEAMENRQYRLLFESDRDGSDYLHLALLLHPLICSLLEFIVGEKYAYCLEGVYKFGIT